MQRCDGLSKLAVIATALSEKGCIAFLDWALIKRQSDPALLDQFVNDVYTEITTNESFAI